MVISRKAETVLPSQRSPGNDQTRRVEEISYLESENYLINKDEEDGDEKIDNGKEEEVNLEKRMQLDAASPTTTEVTVPSVTREMEQFGEEPESFANDSRPLSNPLQIPQVSISWASEN